MKKNNVCSRDFRKPLIELLDKEGCVILLGAPPRASLPTNFMAGGKCEVVTKYGIAIRS